MLLQFCGHEVLTTYSGVEAIEAARLHRPDAILLDIGLPVMNGYEVASRLRAERSCEKVLIVALSGYGQEEDRRRIESGRLRLSPGQARRYRRTD